MKKFAKKTLVVIGILCLSLFALTACSNNADNAADNSDETTMGQEADAIHEYEDINTTVETADDYFAALDIFTSAASNVKTDLAKRMEKIEPQDTESVQNVVETVKKPFTQFLNVTPVNDYAEVNQYYVDACNQILQYIDKTVAGEDAEDLLTSASENISKANTEIANALANSGKDASAETNETQNQ